ncbi:hypothetical protein K431DRAFT_44585 [Polychaeton citri CBS 116435]|uniref:Uncharacterized protein n=1 Tax=Polychaeton citri CBS 116435 TaxID=1314669 RepID=A0A9P4Q8C5_9PEZI|nr:hypothetical protein K431DRAFT_44585 [Polychaeton citri CBS 116435]
MPYLRQSPQLAASASAAASASPPLHCATRCAALYRATHDNHTPLLPLPRGTSHALRRPQRDPAVLLQANARIHLQRQRSRCRSDDASCKQHCPGLQRRGGVVEEWSCYCRLGKLALPPV